MFPLPLGAWERLCYFIVALPRPLPYVRAENICFSTGSFKERAFHMVNRMFSIRPICYLSLVMRKPDFCKCENKNADQLRGNHEADQRLCFRYIDSTIPLLHQSEI